MKKDKILHFTVCFLIAIGMMSLFYMIKSPYIASMLAAMITSIGVGLGKEYGDKCAQGNFWDWYDILADAVGAIIGTLFGSILWI